MKFTKEMAEQLCTAITHDGLDCGINTRWSKAKNMWQYRITWVFKDIDGKGKSQYWEFTIVVPEINPEEFEVHGSPGNPGYTTPLRLPRKEEVRQTAFRELYKILEQSQEWQEEQKAKWDTYVELHGG
jgi:hypothetical protein